jgi:hypothetical protein
MWKRHRGPESRLRGLLRAGGDSLTIKVLTGYPAYISDARHFDTCPQPILGVAGNPNLSRCAILDAAVRLVADIR